MNLKTVILSGFIMITASYVSAQSHAMQSFDSVIAQYKQRHFKNMMVLKNAKSSSKSRRNSLLLPTKSKLYYYSNEWVYDANKTYTYSDLGFLLKEAIIDTTVEPNKLIFQKTYTYNINGLLTSETDYQIFYPNVYPKHKDSFEYDANGFETFYGRYLFNINTLEWEKIYSIKNKYTFDNDMLSSISLYNLIDGEYSKFYTDSFVYESGKIVSKTKTYHHGNFNQRQFTYRYSNVMLEEILFFDIKNGINVNTVKHEFDSFLNTNIEKLNNSIIWFDYPEFRDYKISEIRKYVLNSDSIYLPIRKYKYDWDFDNYQLIEYDWDLLLEDWILSLETNKNIIGDTTIILVRSYNNGQLHSTSRHTEVVGRENELLEFKTELFNEDNNTWVVFMWERKIKTYDLNGKIIEIIDQFYFTNNENELSNIKKESFIEWIDNTTEITKVEKSSPFLIYPNPTTNSFTVSASNISATDMDSILIDIHDINGKVLFHTKMEGNSLTINAIDLGLRPGLYFIRMSSNDMINNWVYKIVIN